MANDRITQEPVEVLVQPDNAKGRITQEPVEVLIQPDNAKGRMTQLPVEVLVLNLQPPSFQVFIID